MILFRLLGFEGLDFVPSIRFRSLHNFPTVTVQSFLTITSEIVINVKNKQRTVSTPSSNYDFGSNVS